MGEGRPLEETKESNMLVLSRKKNESIIINSQLSPNILIMKPISEMETNIRGEIK